MSADRCLATLVSSRICHDLVSPLGAIGNGVELLGMAGARDGAELALISDSVESAAARINYFRLAFGQGAAGQPLSADDCRAAAMAYFAQGRHAIDWRPQGSLCREEARLALLLALCGETALPRGGKVTVDGPKPDWRIAAEGPHIAADEHLDSILSGAPATDTLAAGQVHFALAAATAHALCRPIAIETGDGRRCFSF